VQHFYYTEVLENVNLFLHFPFGFLGFPAYVRFNSSRSTRRKVSISRNRVKADTLARNVPLSRVPAV
jgi:hypothetical protein